MDIVILDGYTENPGDLRWSAFEALGNVTVYDRTPAELILSRIASAEAVITNKTPISAQTIAACPALKYVGVLATGYDVVDIAAAKERGVTVTNVPSYGTEAVAQFAIALLLEIANRVGHHDQAVKQGRWTNCQDWCFWDFPLMELAGKNMGIIGFGRIGQTTGRIAKALGMHVLAHDTFPTPAGEEIARYVSREELFRESDVIVLHCNLTAETKGLVCRENIAAMKDGVILINNSRGPLINEGDLAEALNAGKVAAAAIDVVSSEPILADNPLLKAKNCIITPHISWAPIECRQRIMESAANNLQQYLAGTAVNVVSL